MNKPCEVGELRGQSSVLHSILQHDSASSIGLWFYNIELLVDNGESFPINVNQTSLVTIGRRNASQQWIQLILSMTKVLTVEAYPLLYLDP